MGIFPILIWFPNKEGREASEETFEKRSEFGQEA